MIILAIETSCDETAVAILSFKESANVSNSASALSATALKAQVPETKVLAHIINSQILIHQEFGGVVPEVAARNHLANINQIIINAVKESKINLSDIDYFAATCGPGLIGGLMIGMISAKTLAAIFNKKFVAVNHLAGHALTTRFTNNSQFPFLLLLLSGGHCQIILVSNVDKFKIIGETIDDAVGESFDKVAQMLGLEYPGGPKIEEIAKSGNSQAIKFPKPLFYNKDQPYNFSFSGLKTAVMRYIEQKTNAKFSHQSFKKLTKQEIADIAASFQHTIADILINRLNNVVNSQEIAMLIKSKELCEIVIAGGVAANCHIFNRVQDFANSKLANVAVTAPPLSLCTDNAVMIGWAAIERINKFANYKGDDLSFAPRSSWSLEEDY